jgi:hypothetical protein
VTSVEVHRDTDGGESLDSVVRALEVRGLRLLAVGVAHVRDQVGQRIGLNDSNDLSAWVLLDRINNLVNVVVLVLVDTILVDEEFTVGRLRVTVTVGEIVDDDLEKLTPGGRLLEVLVECGDLVDLVEPDEGRDVLNRSSLRLQGRVRDLGDGLVNLLSVVRAQVDLQGNQRCAAL